MFGEDGSRADSATDLLLVADGKCVVLGTTESYGHGGSDVWLLKTDASGTMQWDLLPGGEGNDPRQRDRPHGGGALRDRG